VETLALYVDKEEKVRMELIVGLHLLERISQVASTGVYLPVCRIVLQRISLWYKNGRFYTYSLALWR
jgi:hypothetical protein